MSVGRASWLFDKHPHLNAIPLNGKAFLKKKPRERSEQGRFFSKNKRRRSRLVLFRGIVQKFARKKTRWNFLFSH
jgi:hypothetical protein